MTAATRTTPDAGTPSHFPRPSDAKTYWLTGIGCPWESTSATEAKTLIPPKVRMNGATRIAPTTEPVISPAPTPVAIATTTIHTSLVPATATFAPITDIKE